MQLSRCHRSWKLSLAAALPPILDLPKLPGAEAAAEIAYK